MICGISFLFDVGYNREAQMKLMVLTVTLGREDMLIKT